MLTAVPLKRFELKVPPHSNITEALLGLCYASYLYWYLLEVKSDKSNNLLEVKTDKI